MNSSENHATDSDLISEVLGGCRERFQQLISRHQKMVYAIAWSQLGNVDLAEEAAQQTFVKAFSRLATLRDTSKFRSWLAAIARNASVSLGRSRRRELSNSARWSIESVAKQDSSSTEQANLTEELRQTLAGLPDAHRQVLTLFYLESQSVRNVALTLNLSESAVKTRLSRARNLLRRELERRLGESLSGLEPSHSLVVPVMAALSASFPMGDAVKMTLMGQIEGVVAKTLGGLAVPVATLAIGMIPSWFLSSHVARQAVNDFQDGEKNDFRRKSVRRNHAGFMALLFFAGLMAVVLIQGFGVHTTFFVIAAYCLWGIWQGWRYLRINDSKLSRAAIACLVLWFVVCLAMGACMTTSTFDLATFGMTPIALTMMLHGTILYRYRPEVPVRTDNNLFLRAATGGLRPGAAHAETTAEHKQESVQFDSDRQEAFAKLLGQNWLISNYHQSGNSIRLDLPAVRFSKMAALVGSIKSTSSITIDGSGQCELCFSSEDQAAIAELAPQSDEMNWQTRLTSILKQAVNDSVRDFSNGDRTEAIRILCGTGESEIFKPDARRLQSQRQKRYYLLSLAACVFLILLWPTTFWLIEFTGAK